MTCSFLVSGGRLQYTHISKEPYILMYSLQPSCGSLTYTKASVLQCVAPSSNIHQSIHKTLLPKQMYTCSLQVSGRSLIYTPKHTKEPCLLPKHTHKSPVYYQNKYIPVVCGFRAEDYHTPTFRKSPILSCRTCGWVMPQTWVSHIAHVNKLHTNISKEPYILMYSLQASCLCIYLFFAGFGGNLTYTKAHKRALFTTNTHA